MRRQRHRIAPLAILAATGLWWSCGEQSDVPAAPGADSDPESGGRSGSVAVPRRNLTKVTPEGFNLARYYLLKTGLPCAEISFLLGYEDPNSFFRAFHEWTGATPEGLRRDGSATGAVS